MNKGACSLAFGSLFFVREMKSYNIVIVDDEPMITSSLKALLKLEGYSGANFFNSPEKALEYIRNNRVDLIISDFYMPGINGIELLKQARAINSGTTLVLLTGYADKESAIRAINEIGLYRYIEKPWDNDDLLLCIKTGLERSHLIENLEATVRERTQELRDANYRLSAIINHSADGIITVSKEGEILQYNPAFCAMCGIDEPVDMNICSIAEDMQGYPLTTRFDDKDVFIRDYKVKNQKTGKLTPVEISLAPIPADNEKGKSYFVGVIRDVTYQHEMERLRDDFIATLTHDLRTPLLAAIQTLRFFLDGTLGEFGEKPMLLLDTMKKSNEDMLGLVNALLEVYKYESGKLDLYKENFVLADMIKDCVQEVRPLAENRELMLVCGKIDDKKVCADRHELKRVIINLLGNAVMHTGKGGKVEISAEFSGNEVVVAVQDTGMGIPAEDIPKLFGRFSQGTGKKRSVSTGLGLYLSRQIVEAHGGRIWAESELNKGSRFIFSIPVEHTAEKACGGNTGTITK